MDLSQIFEAIACPLQIVGITLQAIGGRVVKYKASRTNQLTRMQIKNLPVVEEALIETSIRSKHSWLIEIENGPNMLLQEFRAFKNGFWWFSHEIILPSKLLVDLNSQFPIMRIILIIYENWYGEELRHNFKACRIAL